MELAPIVTGRVIQENGSPISGARVTAWTPDGTLCGHGMSDAAGRFQVPLVCLGIGRPATVADLVFELCDALGEAVDTLPERRVPGPYGGLDLRVSDAVAQRLLPVAREPDEFTPHEVAALLEKYASLASDDLAMVALDDVPCFGRDDRAPVVRTFLPRAV